MRTIVGAAMLALGAGWFTADGATAQAPPARDVLRTCREAIFVDCFRKWQNTESAAQPAVAEPRSPLVPPAVTPETAPRPAVVEPTKPPPGARPQPPVATPPRRMPPTAGPQPVAQPERGSTAATGPHTPIYQALQRAIQELGLQNQVRLGAPPAGGSLELNVDLSGQ